MPRAPCRLRAPPTALKIACSAHAPRQQVDFVIYKLAKRLINPSWVIALKSLMVFHRLMRECDPSFQEQVHPPGRNRGGTGTVLGSGILQRRCLAWLGLVLSHSLSFWEQGRRPLGWNRGSAPMLHKGRPLPCITRILPFADAY
jgi:hypothetical protein